jgi:type II secretory pathway pseudopilin PulG
VFPPISHFSFPTSSPRASRAGQSLVEILVAVGVGVVVVIGAITVLSPATKTQGDALKIQSASALGKELLENVRAWGEGDWHNITVLATTSANKYYLIASTSPFTVATGTQTVTLATSTFTRYFYLDDVYRSTGKIDSSGSFDPSTKKITVVYGWGSGTGSTTSYLARTGDQVFTQSDWSGGSGQEGPLTATGTNAKFASSSAIDTTTSTGSLVIQGF